MMAETVAQGQLRAFVERVERIEEEIKALNSDKSEIYAEAKANGFDVPTIKKVVRARKLDANERMEQDALFDLYMSALGMIPADEDDGPSRVHVHVREADHDPETGEVVDTSSHRVEDAPAPPVQDAACTPLAGDGGEADRHPIPEHTTAPDAPASEGAADDAPLPPRSNVETFATRTHNPATHFLNAKGLERLHGCLRPEACAGSHQALCFSCSVQKQDGEAA